MNKSDNPELNYLMANILTEKVYEEEIFKAGLYVKIFQISDSKATPEDLFQGYDGVLNSFLISVTPDGDYYSDSKLFKIEGFINPVFKGISEAKYPEFFITIEYGPDRDRKIREFGLNAE